MRNKKEMIEKLREFSENKCSLCLTTLLDGKDDISQVHHILHPSLGGTNDLSNLQLLCPNCHYKIHKTMPIQSYEFEKYIFELINANLNFRNTQSLHRSRDFLGDIVTERKIGEEWEKLIVEVKYFTVLGSKFSEYLRHLTMKNIGIKTVLVCPGKLTEKTYSQLREANIEVWDREYLESRFHNEINEIAHPVFTQQLLNIPVVGKEDLLISELRKCGTGKNYWFKYQKLVGEILTYLFCPPLSAALSEKNDEPRANRRDFIFPNYADKGFWEYIRLKYCADYIVVDAKNHSTSIGKKDVLQIAHYLKDYGTGLFAIIVARKGINKNLYYILREIWITERKMIIILNDDDIEQMLLEKKCNRDSNEIIKQKIMDFRVSL